MNHDNRLRAERLSESQKFIIRVPSFIVSQDFGL